jgi:hypothetical protein
VPFGRQPRARGTLQITLSAGSLGTTAPSRPMQLAWCRKRTSTGQHQYGGLARITRRRGRIGSRIQPEATGSWRGRRRRDPVDEISSSQAVAGLSVPSRTNFRAAADDALPCGDAGDVPAAPGGEHHRTAAVCAARRCIEPQGPGVPVERVRAPSPCADVIPPKPWRNSVRFGSGQARHDRWTRSRRRPGRSAGPVCPMTSRRRSCGRNVRNGLDTSDQRDVVGGRREVEEGRPVTGPGGRVQPSPAEAAGSPEG